VEPVAKFYAAEDYHQLYYDNNATQPYCQFVIAPKLKKFEEKVWREDEGLSSVASESGKGTAWAVPFLVSLVPRDIFHAKGP